MGRVGGGVGTGRGTGKLTRTSLSKLPFGKLAFSFSPKSEVAKKSVSACPGPIL